MSNVLEPGAGGAPSARESDNKSNPLRIKSKSQPESPEQTQFGTELEGAKSRFDKMKEAERQISATVTEMGKLNAMADTVTVKDVVSACAGIVAAGVPAVSIATILADMPEQQLQPWVKQKYDEAVAGEQKVSQILGLARHQLAVAGIKSVAAHSAEAHHNAKMLASAQPMGSA